MFWSFGVFLAAEISAAAIQTVHWYFLAGTNSLAGGSVSMLRALALTHTHTFMHTYCSCFSRSKMERLHVAVCVCVCLLTVTYFYGAHSLRMIKILQFFLLLRFLPPFNLSLTPSPLSSSLHPSSHHSFQVSFFLIPLLFPVSHFLSPSQSRSFSLFAHFTLIFFTSLSP